MVLHTNYEDCCRCVDKTEEENGSRQGQRRGTYSDARGRPHTAVQEGSYPNDNYDFAIKNIYGQTIQIKNNFNSENIFDVSGFSSGIYLLMVSKNNSLTGTVRFVVIN